MSLFLINWAGRPVTFCHVPKTGGTSIRRGREIEGPMFTDPGDWPTTPVLAFVRNPYERIESVWRDFRFLRPRTKLEFHEFVMGMADPARAKRISQPSTPEHHAAPMTHPVHGLQHATWVGRFECLEHDFRMFCEEHGLHCFDLPHLRESPKQVEAEWTDESREIAREYYSEDFKLGDWEP